MTAPEMFDETESYGSYEDFEFASEAAVRDHRRAPPRIFVPGGVSSATLNTPKGPAKLNLPSAVPTLQQYRTLEQAVTATNARLSQATADLARIRQELALRRRDQAAGGGMMSLMFPLLMQRQLQDDLEDHTHVGSSAAAVIKDSGSSFTTFLPFLLLMQPNMFGGSSSSSPATGGQDGMSQMMMMFVMMEAFRKRGD
jgi:hypothetical protein